MSEQREQYQEKAEGLKREISRLAIATLIINGLIGAGIFGLPSEAARLTGTFSPLMFVICGLLMLTVMLSFGKAASYFQGTGGPILYAQTAFGDYAGFQTGWLLYIGRATAVAANTNLLTTYLANIWPASDQGIIRSVDIIIISLFFTVINVLGIKQGVGTVMIITAIKLIPLAIFIFAGLPSINAANFQGAALPSYSNFGQAVLVLFYAFIGFEGALVPAGESRNPRVDMPKALFLTAGVTMVLYVLIQTVCIGVFPAIASSKRPLADAATMFMGYYGGLLIAVGAIISVIGNVAATMVTAPRMTYTLARDETMPAWFGAVSDSYKTPHWSIIFFGTFVAIMAVSGTFTWLVGMSSLTRIIGYSLCIAALPRIEKKFNNPDTALHLPGGMLIPVIALLICAWLITQVSINALLVSLLFIFFGTLLFAWARRQRN